MGLGPWEGDHEESCFEYEPDIGIVTQHTVGYVQLQNLFCLRSVYMLGVMISLSALS